MNRKEDGEPPFDISKYVIKEGSAEQVALGKRQKPSVFKTTFETTLDDFTHKSRKKASGSSTKR